MTGAVKFAVEEIAQQTLVRIVGWHLLGVGRDAAEREHEREVSGVERATHECRPPRRAVAMPGPTLRSQLVDARAAGRSSSHGYGAPQASHSASCSRSSGVGSSGPGGIDVLDAAARTK